MERIMKQSSARKWFSNSLPAFLLNLAIFLILGLQTASAASLEACRRYAAESVRQNEQNIALKAGFTGPAWNSSFDYHYNWCIQGNNLSGTPVHLANRERALQDNAIKFAKEPFKRYAAESVRQYNESNAMGAGFGPPVWSPDYSSHYNWCRQGKNVLTTPDHLANREKALQEYAILHNKGPAMKMMQGYQVMKPSKPSVSEGPIPALAVKPKNKRLPMVENKGLRQAIAVQNGGRLTVTPSTSFSILNGDLESRHQIDVPEIGLYKIHIDLAPTVQGVYVSPRIDAEGVSYQMQTSKSVAALKPTLNATKFQIQGQNTAKFQKKASGSYIPWITNDSNLSTAAPVPSDFYFWVDKAHLPSSGKLQFRLQVTGAQKKTASGSKGEIGESGFMAQTPSLLKDHPDIKGRFQVDYAVSYKAAFNDQFNINGTSVPYSIMTLPSVQESGMAFSVIETPVLDLAGDTHSQGAPALSFFIANAQRLSSQNSPTNENSDPAGGITVVKNQNAWIYKDIFSKEYGQINNCSRLALNGASICSKEKQIRYYSWDMPTKGYTGSLLVDVAQPPTGSYSTVITNNPIDARVTTIELLTTRGWLAGSGLHAGDDLRNEVVVAARNAAPVKWTYVAELSRIAVSDQAETGDDDADDNFGEFSLLTTSVLTEPLRQGQIALGPDQVVSRSMPFPMVDNEDRPHNFGMRPPGNKGGDPVHNAGAITYPRVPIFVMDYDKLKTYDSVMLNVLMTEHDEKTFWQENGAVIKAFFNLCKDAVGMASGYVKKDLFKPEDIAKKMYSFASTQLNSSIQVDDFMGNASILVYAKDNFGLLDKREIIYTPIGPADSNCFDMTYNASNNGSASVSQSTPKCGNSRNVSASIKFRKIQQLNSWADIRLISYTTVDDGVFSFLPDTAFLYGLKKTRDQHVTEGLLSNSHSSYQVTEFKDVKSGQVLTVRTPQQELPSNTAVLNKGVIKGSEWKRGQQTMNSQRWDGMGFTYYQAAVEDITGLGRFPTATISFTLYHEDVIKHGGEKDFYLFDAEGEQYTIGIKSTKIPNTNYYKVDIKLFDIGDWIEEVTLMAYVHVN